jgi:hypothetical protein
MEHDGAEQVSTFLVEHYWPGVTADGFGNAVERVRASTTQLAEEGERIRFLHSTLVPEDEAAFCVFEAGAGSVVDQAYRRAGVSYERMVDAVESVAASDGVHERKR